MKAVFLDRDGVINRKAPEGQYISCWDEFRFLPGVFSSALNLQQAGFKIIVVTNQRGLALGEVSLADLQDIHARMKTRFAERGVTISAIYFCPHDISENCLCRKPKPGMLMQAAAEHKLELSSCWIIGDAASDIRAGASARCRTARILPPSFVRANDPTAETAEVVAPDLSEAVRSILQLLDPGR